MNESVWIFLLEKPEEYTPNCSKTAQSLSAPEASSNLAELLCLSCAKDINHPGGQKNVSYFGPSPPTSVELTMKLCTL